MKTYHTVNRRVDILTLTSKGAMPDDLAAELHHHQDITKGKETDIPLALGIGMFNGMVCKVAVRPICTVIL